MNYVVQLTCAIWSMTLGLADDIAWISEITETTMLSCIENFDSTGVCVLPSFLTDEALLRIQNTIDSMDIPPFGTLTNLNVLLQPREVTNNNTRSRDECEEDEKDLADESARAQNYFLASDVAFMSRDMFVENAPELASKLSQIYESESVLSMLSHILGVSYKKNGINEINPSTDFQGSIVATYTRFNNKSLNWHFDEHAFGFGIIIKKPRHAINSGGFEYVPFKNDIIWDKKQEKFIYPWKKIEKIINCNAYDSTNNNSNNSNNSSNNERNSCNANIHSINLREGDGYIFHGNVTLHRSQPLIIDSDYDNTNINSNIDMNEYRIAIIFSYMGKHEFHHSNYVKNFLNKNKD